MLLCTSVDQINFIHPIDDNEIYIAEAVVTGMGKTFLEVYATAHVLDGKELILA